MATHQQPKDTTRYPGERLTAEEWDRRFQKYIDPDYYGWEPRSLVGSTLNGRRFSIPRKSRAGAGPDE